ncbi:MAG: PD-(D/E)XK nuclease family protein, partial [Deltaproteobacteria bacterium]
MARLIRISAKTLGKLAMPDYCARCFWIQQRAKNLPYQIFPGIFSAIDSYGKKIVHGWFDRHGTPPLWLAPLGDLRGYVSPPHHSKFQITDQETGIVLSGTPDGILKRADGSRVIVDYKTARFTEFQDELFPMYEAQLNAYAHLGERLWTEPISALALVYTEPATDDSAANDLNLSDSGFRMPFAAKILAVERKPQLVPELL